MRSWSFEPIVNRIRSRLIGEPELHKNAADIIEICPVEHGDQPAAIYLPGQLDRIRPNPADRLQNLPVELARMELRAIRHEATIAFLLQDAVLIDGILYTNRLAIPKGVAKRRFLPRQISAFIESAALPSSVVGSRFFGHFIAEDCATALLAASFDELRWVASTMQKSTHSLRYLELYRLSRESLTSAKFRHAWHFQDFAMNSNKRARLRKLRELVRAIDGRRSGHGVFFRRRGAGAPRGFVNEPAIEERLARDGFEIIDVTCESVDQIIARTRDAEVVVGVEGSALMHGLLSMSDGGAVVCIQPPYRFTGVLKDHADALGMTFGFVVGEGNDEAFEVSEADLLRTIELALYCARA